MDDFHITVISPTPAHIDDIFRAFDDTIITSKISVVEKQLSQLGTPPDTKAGLEILIVDCDSGDLAGLEQVERLSKLYKHMVFILVCEQQTSEFLLQAMRAGVSEVLSFPLDGKIIKEALYRLLDKHAPTPKKAGKVLTFISCKGGSGATFLACNLAYDLSVNENIKVALFDLNLHFGDALLFLSNQFPAATLLDVAHGIHRLDQSLLSTSMVHVTPDLAVLAAPEDASHAEDVTPEDIDALIKLARTQFDFIVIDVGRNLNALTIKALDLADMIFPVVQTTLPFIRDGKRLLEAFSNLNYPKNKIHLIVNRLIKGGDIQLHHVEQGLKTKVSRSIPNHYETVAASVNQGVPITKLAHNSPVSKALVKWSEDLISSQDKKEKSWMKRTFKRLF